jgi:cell division protease FtsH
MAIDFKRYGRHSARPGDRTSRIYKRAVRARRRAEKAFAPSLGGPVADALVYAVIRRALRPVADLWRDLPVVVALDLPEGIAAEQVTAAFDRIDAGIPSKDGAGLRSTTAVISAEAFRSKTRKGGPSSLRREILRDIRGHRRVVLAMEAGLAIPQDVVPLLDHRIAITGPTPAQIERLVRYRLGITLPPDTITALTSLPLGDLGLILRAGANLRQIELRLARHLSGREVREVSAQVTTPTLQELPGMGAATDWGFDLAQDLGDWAAGRLPWRDVDRGILLYGNPGTGKTTFAKALAATCGVPLIAGSIARWQAAGHLGDLLAAMREAFSQAMEKAPSILFIDELDSVGDRATFSGHNAGYQTEVVNGLLECLDGVEGREGVVVVGACNYPERIDPGVLRSGRLDRSIEIPLPDADARSGILHFHLRGDLAGEDLDVVVHRSDGWTGADLERLVRDARRLARKARRPLRLSDLDACLPALHRPTEDEVRRMAIHETGHAVVATVLGWRPVEKAWIVRELVASENGAPSPAGGVTRLRPGSQVLRTDADRQAELTILLAGMAAEEVNLGSRSEGSSGGPGSDLYRATVMAARFELQLGFGVSPIHLPSQSDEDLLKRIADTPDLRGRVELRLGGRYAVARAILTERTAAVREIAAELAERSSVTGEWITDVLERHDRSRTVDRGRTCLAS